MNLLPVHVFPSYGGYVKHATAEQKRKKIYKVRKRLDYQSSLNQTGSMESIGSMACVGIDSMVRAYVT